MKPKRKPLMTLDEMLKPMDMTCGKCNRTGTAYPTPFPEGIFFCPNCSPLWLDSFAKFALKSERERRGLV